MNPFPLIAVDVGNARVKLGRFDALGEGPLPEPSRTLHVSGRPLPIEEVAGWIDALEVERIAWWIGSVNRPAATSLIDRIREQRPNDPVTLLSADDLPLRVALDRPDMVGVDRLLDAVAANQLRQPGRAAIVVDVGTAITVDLVDVEGAFCGGAILPGIAMAARAMHEFTDLLPLLDMRELTAIPPPIGQSTESALRSGLFWGAVGAIRELVDRTTQEEAARPHVFLTGGAGPAVAQLLGESAEYLPYLTLAGIVLAAHGARNIR
ncbi:MAG: type III pantothenate kinase [Pirellulales bacterium]|nr:type III pantothenate kinase [Pirellulales bacterium]